MKFGEVPTGIDLVDFKELRMFMFREDNLYRINVPEERRNFSVLQHYQEVLANGYPKSHITLENAAYNEDSRYVFHMLIAHLHQYGIPVHLLDIGGFIGDFSLLLANFARSCNIRFRADVFDPSPAGALIPYNIEINGLQDYVTFHELAASHIDGPLKFTHRIGHLDSASVSMGENLDVDYLVRSTRVSTFIRKHDIPSKGLMVKIDTEGLEPVIVQDVLNCVTEAPIIIFEFTPRTFVEHQIDCVGFLTQLSRLYHLFDVSHLPYASRARAVDENKLLEFAQTIANRQCGYADVLLIPREIPGWDELEKKIALMEKGQCGFYNLVGSSRGGSD